MAQDLKKLLKSRLAQAKKVVVLGVGSELRGDDAAGYLLGLRLEKLAKSRGLGRRLKVLFGSTAPENFTGEIKGFKPTHLIIVDAASMKKKAGTPVLIEPDQIEGISFSTHQLPLSILISYVREAVGCEILTIGIQPKTLRFGAAPTADVIRAVDRLASLIIRSFLG